MEAMNHLQVRPVARAALRVLALAVLILPLGCGGLIVGRWRPVQAVPNRDVFYLDDAEFRSNGTFSGTLTLDGRTVRTSGRYAFNGFKLRLRPEAGGQHAFGALLRLGRLELTDRDRKVVLERTKKEPA